MIGIAVVASLTLLLGIVAIASLRPPPARFRFADREDHVRLSIEGRLGSDDRALVTMSALREAVRLKLVSDYKRWMVDVTRARLADEASFWLLIGGLGPMLISESIRSAIVSGPKTPMGRRLHQAGFLHCFGSESEALAWLRSHRPAMPTGLDREWVESLLVARGRVTLPPLRRAA